MRRVKRWTRTVNAAQSVGKAEVGFTPAEKRWIRIGAGSGATLAVFELAKFVVENGPWLDGQREKRRSRRK